MTHIPWRTIYAWSPLVLIAAMTYAAGAALLAERFTRVTLTHDVHQLALALLTLGLLHTTVITFYVGMRTFDAIVDRRKDQS